MNKPNPQDAYRAHIAYGEQEPEAMGLALQVINRWGSGEATLAQAIAEQLKACYNSGIEREMFPYEAPPPPSSVMRRAKAAPPPPVVVLRRRK